MGVAKPYRDIVPFNNVALALCWAPQKPEIFQMYEMMFLFGCF